MTPPPDGPPEELGVLLPLQLETKFRQVQVLTRMSP